MVTDILIMPLNLTHTKIYGHGAADVLKQNEINATIVDGSLNILLNKYQNLVIVAEGSKLRFYLESVELTMNGNSNTEFQ